MADSGQLAALLVKLEADTASFRSEMMGVSKSVQDSAKKIESQLSGMSSSSIAGFGKLGGAINTAFAGLAVGGVVAAGIFAVKEALDQVFEAENIKAAGAQFELLARNAGVAGAALREGLVNAADGLVDDTDLIMAANRSLVSMGAAAKDLPQVMELARKATNVFGGEVSQNFEAMATAIANGQTKALKNMGIVVDSEKVYKDFAKSIGVTADRLTEAGKQQALMNAVLEQGKSSFAGVDANIKQNTNTWQQLKVTIGQIGEVITLAFEKLAGPTIQKVLSGLKQMAIDAKTVLTANFGDGAEKASAQVELLTQKVYQTQDALNQLKEKQNTWKDFAPGETQVSIQILTKRLQEYKDELTNAQSALATEEQAQQKANQTLQQGAVKTRELIVAKNELAEAGLKLAKNLNEASPEAIQKLQLEALQIQFEDHLITVEDFYARQLEIQGKKIGTEKEMLAAARAENLIGEEQYQLAIENLSKRTALEQQKMAAKRKQDEQKDLQEKLGYTSQFFGSMARLQSVKSKELYEIGKAAAVAQAVVDGYAAVQKTLASVPYPFSIPLAAAAGIAAAANVASIVSAPPPAFAAGGIVPGTKTIGDQVPVMANAGEMMLNNSQQQRLFGMLNGNVGSGGGGQVAELLGAILGTLQRLSPTVTATVDGRVLFEAVNDQVKAGRRFAN